MWLCLNIPYDSESHFRRLNSPIQSNLQGTINQLTVEEEFKTTSPLLTNYIIINVLINLSLGPAIRSIRQMESRYWHITMVTILTLEYSRTLNQKLQQATSCLMMIRMVYDDEDEISQVGFYGNTGTEL